MRANLSKSKESHWAVYTESVKVRKHSSVLESEHSVNISTEERDNDMDTPLPGMATEVCTVDTPVRVAFTEVSSVYTTGMYPSFKPKWEFRQTALAFIFLRALVKSDLKTTRQNSLFHVAIHVFSCICVYCNWKHCKCLNSYAIRRFYVGLIFGFLHMFLMVLICTWTNNPLFLNMYIPSISHSDELP